MTDAYILDAVRTPVGRFGGAFASVRPDDLAATVVRAIVERTGIDPAARGRRDLRVRQPGGRGQPQRGADGAPARRPSRHRRRADGEPALRIGAGGRAQRHARHPRRRGRDVHRGRRGEHDTRAVGDAQAGGRLRPRRAADGGLAPRLALRQPEDAAGVDRLPGRDGGDRGRGVRRQPRGPGRVRVRQPAARGEGHRRGPLRGRDRPRGGAAAQGPAEGRGHGRAPARGHHAGVADGAQGRLPQAERHGDGRQLVGAERRRVRAAGGLRRGGGAAGA